MTFKVRKNFRRKTFFFFVPKKKHTKPYNTQDSQTDTLAQMDNNK